MSSTVELEDGCRGVGPLVGVVLLVAITVCLVAVVAAVVGAWSLEPAGSTAAFALDVDADRNAVTIEHVAGDPVDVAALTVWVEVNGEPLADQPPVPFVGAEGFYGTPEGPFNAEAEPRWIAGERATFRIAETNAPTVEAGDEVVIRLAVDGRTIAELSATAG
ncbi:type IV pilin N-terminal domain-containing protein [Natronobeatus ordinarius]|uniref:type IV pilin N-terminal domain-containing protein n=1 Tax=Natronobeatus ordinarius TaxID=2963433 RepID=UPI0020CDEB36|nr:type IV pilin N-terminal domain-containing protein [Natronobeatus ordinarius]